VNNKNSRPWRIAIGGLWEELGKLQFNFLLKNGLKPNHFLLDIGCGCLRGGIHFINYLDSGHYFGIDKNPKMLEGGRIELEEANLLSKNPNLKLTSNFDYSDFDQNFDFALAQSLFTHLKLDKIETCLINTDKVLKKNCSFFATIFENFRGKEYLGSISHSNITGQDIITYPNKDPFHYSFETFEDISKKTNLEAKYIGDWKHPRNQTIVVFVKK